MDRILNALKCVNCREILSSPVILPCSHTICHSHTQVSDEHIICANCGSRHANNGFIVNQAVSDMISAQLNKLDFGHQHSETSKSCTDLKIQLDKNDAMLDNLDYFIHESIGELKNQVILRSEQLKVRIEMITREIIEDLDEYERRCKTHCGNTDSKESLTLLNEFRKQNEEAKKSWNEWSSSLNELKVDVDKWAEIKVKCDEALKNMCEKIKDFKKDLFLNEFDSQKFQVEFFKKANIDPVLKKKVKFQIFLETFLFNFLKNFDHLDTYRIEST